MGDEKQPNTKTIKFPNWLLFIRDNLGLIILVPTFLGGLWQVASLLSFGFSYLRFFSLSQLVSDGLLLIILLPLLAIFPIVTYPLGKSIVKSITDIKSKFGFIKQIIWYIVFSTILGYIIVVYYEYLASIFKKEIEITVEIFAFVFLLPIFFGVYHIGSSISDKYEKFIKDSDRNKFIKWIYKNLFGLGTLVQAILMVGGGMSIVLVFFRILSSTGDYFIPDNIANIRNLEKTVCIYYNLDPREYEIAYFNDSYIFIRHITVSQEELEKLSEENKSIPDEIYILKFDELFKVN